MAEIASSQEKDQIPMDISPFPLKEIPSRLHLVPELYQLEMQPLEAKNCNWEKIGNKLLASPGT